MSYRERLHPWSIVRLLPDVQRVTVARFRRRNEAEARLSFLQQRNPHENFVVVFDHQLDEPVPQPLS
jgi:hypothetical protein